jgi:hypothetical protein
MVPTKGLFSVPIKGSILHPTRNGLHDIKELRGPMGMGQSLWDASNFEHLPHGRFYLPQVGREHAQGLERQECRY